MPIHSKNLLLLPFLALAASAPAQTPAPASPKYPAYPSEIPATFTPTFDGWDYVKRTAEIPMRDGVKLHTVILVPKSALGAKSAPILLTRTPYDADTLTKRNDSAHLGMALDGYDNPVETVVEGGYIRVVAGRARQVRLRGRLRHEPPAPRTAEPDARRPRDGHVGHDRLAREERPRDERKGRHPRDLVQRLHAAHGAREPAPGAEVLGADEPDGGRLAGRRLVPQRRVPPARDVVLLRPGSDAEERREVVVERTSTNTRRSSRRARRARSGRRRGLEQVGMWRKVLAHPAYDAFWKDQALDRILAAQPLKVPVMLVHSLWDQEDIYGAPAVYKAIEPKDAKNDMVFLVLGPWHHGQENREGSALGRGALRLRHGALVPAEHPAAVPRRASQGRRAEGRRRPRHGVRNRARTPGGA